MVSRQVASLADRYIGNSQYKWGGGRTQSERERGIFDCSSFTQHIFRQMIGKDIGATTREQRRAGKKVSPSNMRPGDLVFFDTNRKDGHVGIYMGNGKVLGAQNSTGVAIFDMNASSYWRNAFNGHVRRVM